MGRVWFSAAARVDSAEEARVDSAEEARGGSTEAPCIMSTLVRIMARKIAQPISILPDMGASMSIVDVLYAWQLRRRGEGNLEISCESFRVRRLLAWEGPDAFTSLRETHAAFTVAHEPGVPYTLSRHCRDCFVVCDLSS